MWQELYTLLLDIAKDSAGVLAQLHPDFSTSSFLAPLFLFSYDGDLNLELDEQGLTEFLSVKNSSLTANELLYSMSRIGTVDE